MTGPSASPAPMTQSLLRAVPPTKPEIIAAAVLGSVALVAAALAAVYAWHRLRGPVPLVAWAARWCLNAQGEDKGDSEEVLTSLKVPKNGIVQVRHERARKSA